jgi:hypothetical protein
LFHHLYYSKLFLGEILSIAPKSDGGSGVNYKVTVSLDEVPEQLRWGMTAFVDIETVE